MRTDHHHLSGHPKARRRILGSGGMQTFFLGGIFLFLLVGFLHYSRPVLLPAILALLISLILQPLANGLVKYLRLPRFLAAFVLVTGLTTAILFAGYFLSEPAHSYIQQLRNDAGKNQLSTLFAPIKEIHNEISDIADQVQDLSEEDESDPEEDESAGDGSLSGPVVDLNPPPPMVTASPPVLEEAKPKKSPTVRVKIEESPVGIVYSVLREFGTYMISTLFLLLFLLAYGSKMTEKFGRRGQSNAMLDEIQREISGYLFTISTINILLGVAIGLGLWLLDIPHAILWGCMATVLNYIPYAGAVLGTLIVSLIAAMETASLGTTLTAGAIYMGLSALEGNVITPAVIGKRFAINPVVIFIWVLLWAVLWGLAGMLISLPILMVVRIAASRMPSLQRFERAITL